MPRLSRRFLQALAVATLFPVLVGLGEFQGALQNWAPGIGGSGAATVLLATLFVVAWST